jgi:hypothetical protein
MFEKPGEWQSLDTADALSDHAVSYMVRVENFVFPCRSNQFSHEAVLRCNEQELSTWTQNASTFGNTVRNIRQIFHGLRRHHKIETLIGEWHLTHITEVGPHAVLEPMRFEIAFQSGQHSG